MSQFPPPPPLGSPAGGIPLDQVQNARKMQEQQMKNNIFGLAVQFFIAGKTESIPDAFTLAERFFAEAQARLNPQIPREGD